MTDMSVALPQSELQALRARGRVRGVLPLLGPERPKFGHGVEVRLPSTDGGAPLTLMGCFHVSPHNTFTGRLTQEMVRHVFRRAVTVADDQE